MLIGKGNHATLDENPVSWDFANRDNFRYFAIRQSFGKSCLNVILPVNIECQVTSQISRWTLKATFGITFSSKLKKNIATCPYLQSHSRLGFNRKVEMGTVNN